MGDRVLAWYLDDEALEADPNYALRWAELIRERDAVFGRPIIMAPVANWSSASKVADILIARTPRIGLIEGPEFESWLASRRRLARPGMPLWVQFNTQFSEATHAQANALTHAAAPSPTVEAEQLEPLLRTASTSGARGFVFQSISPLSDADPATRNRATITELLNRQLQLLEPWLAGGKVVSPVTSTNGARTLITMQVDRARLLIPVPNNPISQRSLRSGRRPLKN